MDKKIKAPKKLKTPRYRIKSNTRELMFVDRALVVGHIKETDKIQMNVQGNISFEEMLDMLNTAQYQFLEYFETSLRTKIKDNEEFNKGRKDIYDRAVWGFSLMIDKFYPEGKDNKFKGLTDRAILKAQDEILLNKQKKA